MEKDQLKRPTVEESAQSFGFEGMSKIYTEIRPRYPKRFYDRIFELLPEDRRRVHIDIGCGPGLVIMDTYNRFERVFGIDVQDTQIAEAKLLLSSLPNVTVAVENAYNLEEFTDKLGITGQIDLITFGNSFHWLDSEKMISILQKVMSRNDKSPGILALFSYWGFEIMTENCAELVKTKYQKVEDFEKYLPDQLISEPSEQAYLQACRKSHEKFYDIIDAHFPYDPLFLKSFLQVNNFDSLFSYQSKILESQIFQYNLAQVLDYQRSVSGYQHYLKNEKIEKESEKDPLL